MRSLQMEMSDFLIISNLKSIAPELSRSVSSIISSISSCPGLSPRRWETCFLFIQIIPAAIIDTHRGTGGPLPIPLWILCRLHPDNHHDVTTLMTRKIQQQNIPHIPCQTSGTFPWMCELFPRKGCLQSWIWNVNKHELTIKHF